MKPHTKKQTNKTTFYLIVAVGLVLLLLLGTVLQLRAFGDYTYIKPTIPNNYIGNTLSMSFEKVVKDDVSKIPKWKEKVMQVINKKWKQPSYDSLPINEPEIVYTTNKQGFTMTKYTMKAFDNDIIIFYELLPESYNEHTPVVIIVPGSGNQGARDVVGIPSDLSPWYYEYQVAYDIVNAGFATYVIENRGYGERAIDVGSACDTWTDIDNAIMCSGTVLYYHLGRLGYDLQQLQVTDTRQLLKYIQTLDYVDTTKIAIGGLSLGGHISKRVAMYNEDITALFIASGTASIAKTFSTNSGFGYLGMIKFIDTTDMLVMHAPKPFYLSYGKEERGLYGFEASTGYTYNYVKNAYDIYGSDNNLTYVIHDGGHEYDIQSVISFLQQTLKPS